MHVFKHIVRRPMGMSVERNCCPGFRRGQTKPKKSKFYGVDMTMGNQKTNPAQLVHDNTGHRTGKITIAGHADEGNAAELLLQSLRILYFVSQMDDLIRCFGKNRLFHISKFPMGI